MDQKQVHLLGLRLLLITLILSVTYASAQNPIRNWQSLTSFNQTKDMLLYNGEIWTATTGGLIRINPFSQSFQTYTNVDGLGTSQLFSLCVDSRNRLWVGGKGFLTNFSDPARPDGYILTDDDGSLIEINDIAASPGGDTLWLAHRIGVSVFLAPDTPGQGLILDTYSRIGTINSKTPATRIALDSGQVWVGTEGGFAVGSRHDIRTLKSPAGWRSYRPSDLTADNSDHVGGLVVKHDTVLIGTLQGLYQFDEFPAPTMISLNLYGGASTVIYNISRQWFVIINTSRGMVFIDELGQFRYINTDGMPIPNSAAGYVDDVVDALNGSLLDGIFQYRQGRWEPFDVGGTPSNRCNDVAFTQGKVWGAFDEAGLASFENGTWTQVPGIVGSANALAVGPLGELWVGTWGGGAYRIMGNDIRHFDTTNAAFSGIRTAPAYVAISDIVATGDAIWFANVQGIRGEIVAVDPYQLDRWERYDFPGSDPDFVTSITVGQGVVYTGSFVGGIHAIAYNGTPTNGGDDIEWQFTAENSGIGSNIIQDLLVDRYDSLWVGTAYGLSFQALGEIFFADLILPGGFGPEVTTLGIDAQGSIYAGSNHGLLVRDIATGEYEVLTSRNSGLADDQIISIVTDPRDNSLFITTREGGISHLSMPYSQAAADIKEVLAYPNPFIISFGTERLRFNYAGQAEVRIFTLAGELVKEIPITGVWDGTNSAGQGVASGMYFFTLTNSDGEVGRGKILLIRH